MLHDMNMDNKSPNGKLLVVGVTYNDFYFTKSELVALTEKNALLRMLQLFDTAK